MGKFATFLIGGVVGIAAGLLLSPRSGAENRAMLNEVINEKSANITIPPAVQEKADQFATAAATTSTKAINTVIDKGQEVYRGASAKVQSVAPVANQVFESGDDLREKIDAARERIATQVAKNAEAVHDAAVDKIPGAVDAVSGATQTAKEAAANAKGVAKEAATNAKEAAVTAATAAKDAATNAVSSVAQKVSKSQDEAQEVAQDEAKSEEE